MFELFRFVMLRSAVTREPHEILSTALDTDFQRQLERDRERPSPAASMERTANQFLEGEGAVSSANPLAFGEAYDALAASLRTAIPADRDALLTEISNASGVEATDLVEEQGFRDDRQRLADALIAAKLGTPRIDLPLEVIARNLRLVALIQRAADGDARLDDPDQIQAALDASIAMPDKLLPIDQPLAVPGREGGERPGDRERPGDDRERRREQALHEYRELTEAHDYLRDVPADHVQDTDASSATAAGLTDEGGAERPVSHERGELSDAIFRELRELRDAVLSHRTIAEGTAAAGIVATGLPLSSARVLQGTMLKIRREALTEAPQAVHAGLRAARVDLATMSLSDAVDRINARRRELAPLVLDDLIGASGAAAGGSNVSLVGGQFVPTSQVPDLVAREERRDDA